MKWVNTAQELQFSQMHLLSTYSILYDISIHQEQYQRLAVSFNGFNKNITSFNMNITLSISQLKHCTQTT